MRTEKGVLYDLCVSIMTILQLIATIYYYVYPYVWAVRKEWSFVKGLNSIYAFIFPVVPLVFVPLIETVISHYLADYLDYEGPGRVLNLTVMAYFYSKVIQWGVIRWGTGTLKIGTTNILPYLAPVLAFAVFLITIFLLLHNFRLADEEEYWWAAFLASLLAFLIQRDYFPEVSLFISGLLCLGVFIIAYFLCCMIYDIQQWIDKLDKKTAASANSRQENDNNSDQEYREQSFNYNSNDDDTFEKQFDDSWKSQKSDHDQEADAVNEPQKSVYFPNVESKIEARSMYREYCKKFHPDNLATGNEECFKEMAEEYQKLA